MDPLMLQQSLLCMLTQEGLSRDLLRDLVTLLYVVEVNTSLPIDSKEVKALWRTT